MVVAEPTPSLLAARLALVALVALRASIGESTALDADRVALAPSASPMSTDAAAQILASRPKPLFCDAKARDSTLVISCRTQSEADARELQWFEMKGRDDEERGGFMGYLEEHYGSGDHLVAVFGRDESLMVPQSVVDRWSREYEIGTASYSADDVDNPWAVSEPDHVEARRIGAKGILRFTSPVTPTYFSAVTLYSDDDDSLSKESEEQLVQMARMNHTMLRGLIDSSKDLTLPQSSSGAWQRKQVEAAKQHLMGTVTMLKHVFKGRTMPPDVAAFVDECAKYFGSQQ